MTNKKTTKKSNLFDLIKSAIFATVICVCALISIPLPFTPVPINLATFGVFIASTLQDRKYSFLSVICYILLGAFGLPVFAGFRGGVGVLLGPTGGFIIGYLFSSLLIGFTYKRENANMGALIIALVLGLKICYICGLLWFMFSTKTGFIASLLACVAPFLIADILKIVLTAVLTKRLDKAK